MPVTKANIQSKFAHLRDTIFADGKVNCTFETDTFDGLKTSLALDQVATQYGLINDYEFSIYADADDVTTRIRDNERLIINSASADVAGESKTMRVLGKSVDSLGGVIRFDLKPINA